MFRITSLRRASGMTTRWFLAPPMAWKRLPFSAHFLAISLQVGVDPTRETPCTRGCSMKASATVRSPLMRV